jgi:hypothetical protein
MNKMLIKICSITMLLFLMAIVSVFVFNPSRVNAQASKASICEGTGGNWNGSSCVSPTNNATVTGTFNKVANVLIFIVGAVSVIMVILGGLRYVMSNGEQAGISSAKNTILYALIGLAVAFMAYAVINFVLTSFKVV